MNQKTRNPIPHNDTRVRWSREVIGLIVRGHVHLGVKMESSRSQKDVWEETYYVYDGIPFVRLTSEMLTELEDKGSYKSFILTMKVVGTRVDVVVDVDGIKSKAGFYADSLPLMRHFLAHGVEFGRETARFLTGGRVAGNGRPQSRTPRKDKPMGDRVVNALAKANANRGKPPRGNTAKKPSQAPSRDADRNSGKGRGNAPGGMGTLGDIAGDKLATAKEMTRSQRARLEGKKIEAPELKAETNPTPAIEAKPEAPAEETAPTKTVTTVQVDNAAMEPTMTKRAARMFVDQLRRNGGDLEALSVTNQANLKVIRESAKEAGIVLKETEHLIQ